MTPTHTRKGGKLYRYYVSTDVLKRGRRGLLGAPGFLRQRSRAP